MSMIDAMKRRSSCRTYRTVPVEPEKVSVLNRVLEENMQGPFGCKVRFRLIDFGELSPAEIRACGTYGVIRGARLFIVGAVPEGWRAREDYGYAMERNILQATLLGLGTCWLGGTFNRTGFAERLKLEGTELLPAVTPIGYAADRRSLVDRVFRFSAGSDKRKPWEELFFDQDFRPLKRDAAGPYEAPMDCIRSGPSASNKQPWRVVQGEKSFHFYLERTPGYAGNFGDMKLQNVDMGIAICHFELACRELGLAGQWEATDPGIDAGGREYIGSWREERN